METVDVLVVGFGAAGLTAAIAAHDAGAEVLVLEKADEAHAGGNCRVSSGVWFSPADPELAKTYLRALCGEYPIAEDLLDAWAHETSRNMEWIRERASEVRGRVPRDPDDPFDGDGTEITSVSYGEAMAQMGWLDAPFGEYPELEGAECDQYNFFGPSMGFSRLWLTLRAALDERGIPVRFASPALELVRGQDGGIDGVVAGTAGGGRETILARRGVVLATGGFANNSEMARNYLRLPFTSPWGSPLNTGDGIRMAQKVGADLAHPGNYMAQPGLLVPPYECGEFAEPVGNAFIYVGADGRRFTDETEKTRHGRIPVRGDFDVFPGVPMWTIFDEDARLAGPIVIPRAAYPGGWMKQVERYDWSADNSVEIERGWITKGQTLRELAEKLGVDPEGLEREVETYNTACDARAEPFPARPVASLTPIRRGPFYGYRWGQVLITTLGGVRKDPHGRAVDPDGAPIPRLYAAGDVASTYTWALSGGMGIGDALAFARIAVRHALGIAAPPRSALAGA